MFYLETRRKRWVAGTSEPESGWGDWWSFDQSSLTDDGLLRRLRTMVEFDASPKNLDGVYVRREYRIVFRPE